MGKKNKTLGAAGSKNKTKLHVLVNENFEALMLEKVGPRLDSVESYVKERLQAIDKRSKDIQSFILGEVKVTINDQLYNADISVKAIEKALVQMFADAQLNFDADKFAKLVDTNKLEINEQTKKEKAEAMTKNIENLIAQAKKEDADKAEAATAAAAESTAQPSEPAVENSAPQG